MEFIALPIEHAGITLTRTFENLTAAFSIVLPHVEHARASWGAIDPATGHNARTHDFTLFKPLSDLRTNLAQSRLIGIIRNKKHLVDALLGGVG